MTVLTGADATLLVRSLHDAIGLVPGLLVQLDDNTTMNIDVGSNGLSNDKLFAAIQKGIEICFLPRLPPIILERGKCNVNPLSVCRFAQW